jgi:hypothetical protein
MQVPDRELSESRRRQIRYGALGVAILLLAAGVIAFSHSSQRTTANPETTPPRRTAEAPPSTTTPDDITPAVNALQRAEAVALIGEARRLAAAGDFGRAEAVLHQAQKTGPDLPEIEQARRDIERLQTPAGSLAQQLQRAQLAIEHDDTATAEAALGEASRIQPNAPEIAALRATLKQSQEKTGRREAQIAQALARMREAVARRDFAAADSALNEAERIDLQNPSIRRARGELARARGTQSNSSN